MNINLKKKKGEGKSIEGQMKNFYLNISKVKCLLVKPCGDV